MAGETTRVVPVRLDEHTVILVEAVARGEVDVTRPRPLDFQAFVRQVGGIARALTEQVRELKPDKTTVEFACSVGVESGQLTALLVKGTANGSVKITMEWNHPA